MWNRSKLGSDLYISLSAMAGKIWLTGAIADTQILFGQSSVISCPPRVQNEPVSNLVLGMTTVGFDDLGDDPAPGEFRCLGDHLDLYRVRPEDLHFLIRVTHVLLKASPDFFDVFPPTSVSFEILAKSFS